MNHLYSYFIHIISMTGYKLHREASRLLCGLPLARSPQQKPWMPCGRVVQYVRGRFAKHRHAQNLPWNHTRNWQTFLQTDKSTNHQSTKKLSKTGSHGQARCHHDGRFACLLASRRSWNVVESFFLSPWDVDDYWNLLKSIEYNIHTYIIIYIYILLISVDMCRWFLNGLDTDRWRLFRCKYRGQACGNFHEHNISETFWNVRYVHFRSFQYVSIHSRPVSFSDSWTAGSQSSWSRRKGA